jgi:hypothetical protein
VRGSGVHHGERGRRGDGRRGSGHLGRFGRGRVELLVREQQLILVVGRLLEWLRLLFGGRFLERLRFLFERRFLGRQRLVFVRGLERCG